MENGKMIIGAIIGFIALLLGLGSLVIALVLRGSTRTNPVNVLRYFFLAGIPILFLCSAAGFWDCYVSKDWTKCLVPIAMLLFAVTALLNRKQSIDLIEKLADKQASNKTKSSTTSREGQ